MKCIFTNLFWPSEQLDSGTRLRAKLTLSRVRRGDEWSSFSHTFKVGAKLALPGGFFSWKLADFHLPCLSATQEISVKSLNDTFIQFTALSCWPRGKLCEAQAHVLPENNCSLFQGKQQSVGRNLQMQEAGAKRGAALWLSAWPTLPNHNAATHLLIDMTVINTLGLVANVSDQPWLWGIEIRIQGCPRHSRTVSGITPSQGLHLSTLALCPHIPFPHSWVSHTNICCHCPFWCVILSQE